ncbi:hypothetical protein HDU84_001491 [Entophlyctis sp. JEL0112]|nr:hypothetical protein HDU84_001491 [Entophlyctis sp. JEL0112]
MLGAERAAAACYELPPTAGASSVLTPPGLDCAGCAGPRVLVRAGGVSEALVLAPSPSCICAPLAWALHPPPSNSSACGQSSAAAALAWALVDLEAPLLRLQERSQPNTSPLVPSASLVAGVLGCVVCLASGLMLFLRRRKSAKEKAKAKAVIVATSKSSKSIDLGDRTVRRPRLSLDESSSTSASSSGGPSSTRVIDDITMLNAPEHILKRDSTLLPFHYEYKSEEVEEPPPEMHRSSSILFKAWASGAGSKKEAVLVDSYRHHRPPIAASSFSEPGMSGSPRQSSQLRRQADGAMNSPRMSSTLWRPSDVYYDADGDVPRASLNFTRPSIDHVSSGRPSFGLGRPSFSSDTPSRALSNHGRPSHEVARTVGNIFGLHLDEGRVRRVVSRTEKSTVGNGLGVSYALGESAQAMNMTLQTLNAESQQDGSDGRSLTIASASRDSRIFSLSRTGAVSSSPTPSSVYMNLLEETGGLEK